MRQARFATRGFVLRNINGDGTAPTPQRMLSASGPVNLNIARGGLSILDAQNKAMLLVRINSTDQLRPVDFSGAVDLMAVTPAEQVIALNAAGFDNMTAIIDNATGRCNFRCIDPAAQYVQVFGYLAGALGFGGSRAFRGMGCFLYDGVTYDDTITIARVEQRSDDQNVDQAGGGLGTLTRVIVKGRRTGVQYAMNIKQEDRLLLQMVEGGELIAGVEDMPTRYSPPASGDDVGERQIELIKIIPLYPDGTQSSVDQESGMETEHCFKGSITPGDPSEGAMTLANFNYTYNAGSEYTDENGVITTQPFTDSYDISLWDRKHLIKSLSPTLGLRLMETYPIEDASLNQTVNLTTSQTAFNPVIKTPSNASGFVVTFDPLETLSDTALSWDGNNSRIRIETGTAKGTETVTVTFTNPDGSEISREFSLTVA
jgi:hypothetical protein